MRWFKDLLAEHRVISKACQSWGVTMRLECALLGLALIGLSQPSLAQTNGPDLDCIDRAGNHNGKIDTDQEILTLALHQDKTFREMDKNCDGEITKAELDAWLSEQKKSFRFKLTVNDIRLKAAAGSGPKIETKRDQTTLQRKGEQPTWSQKEGSSQLYLRQDFADFHTFSSPKAQGVGADFDFTWDQEKPNRSLSAKGVAFVPLIFDHAWDESQRTQLYVGSIALAPSLRFEYLTNSNLQLKKNNVEILTPGVTAEAEIGNVLGWSHFVRTRASLVTNMGHLDNWQIHNEWQPIEPAGHVCIGTPCPLLGTPALFRFDPVLVAEYSEMFHGSDLASQPLFMDHDRAFLLGPTLALKVYPNGLKKDELPVWLQNAEFTTAYNWYQDALSHHQYSRLDTAFTFKADKDDHVGVKLSYSRGNTQDTAQRVNVAKAGVAVKF
jgi:hypothetical protein